MQSIEVIEFSISQRKEVIPNHPAPVQIHQQHKATEGIQSTNCVRSSIIQPDWSEKLYQIYESHLSSKRGSIRHIRDQVHLGGDEKCNCTEKLDDVLEQRLDIKEETLANQEQAFESGKRGLCSVLMKSTLRYVKPDSINFGETYDEIAKFLVPQQGTDELRVDTESYPGVVAITREAKVERVVLDLSSE